jgi:hypothetical protein
VTHPSPLRMATVQVPQRSKVRTMVPFTDYVKCNLCSGGPFKATGYNRHASSKHKGATPSATPVPIVNPNGGGAPARGGRGGGRARGDGRGGGKARGGGRGGGKARGGGRGRGKARGGGQARGGGRGRGDNSGSDSDSGSSTAVSRSSSDSDSDSDSDSGNGEDRDGNALYEVEKITDKRSTKSGLEYYVHWKGRDRDNKEFDPEWTPAVNCKSAQKEILAYEKSLKKK